MYLCPVAYVKNSANVALNGLNRSGLWGGTVITCPASPFPQLSAIL